MVALEDRKRKTTYEVAAHIFRNGSADDPCFVDEVMGWGRMSGFAKKTEYDKEKKNDFTEAASTVELDLTHRLWSYRDEENRITPAVRMIDPEISMCQAPTGLYKESTLKSSDTTPYRAGIHEAWRQCEELETCYVNGYRPCAEPGSPTYRYRRYAERWIYKPGRVGKHPITQRT